MPIFYRKAIEAAVRPNLAEWLQDEHLVDWLLQLSSPAHQALLQIRSLLIGWHTVEAN